MSLAKRVGKKGLSDVVTTVLIILMTVAAIGLIWAFVIPMVRDNLANASVNKQIDLTIKTAGGESCVDYNKGILVVNVFKGEEDFKISKLKFIVISEGSSISFVENEGLQKQTGKDFYLNISGLSSVEKVGVAPYVVDGKKEKLYAAIYANIEDKKCASTAINVSKIADRILNESNSSDNESNENKKGPTHIEDIPEGWVGIETCQELQNMKNNLNGEYILMKNIECGGFNFEPVGCSGEYDYFMGNLEGNNYTINNLYINQPSKDNVGLFGCSNNAKISFISLNNVTVMGGSRGVGSLVGYAHNTIINNSGASGLVKGSSSGDGVGGLTGSDGKVYNSYFIGNVSGDYGIGGLVGEYWSVISNSYAIGNVSGGYALGGLGGQGYRDIVNSYFIGNVSGFGVGGVAGAYDGEEMGGSISNSFYNSEYFQGYGCSYNGCPSVLGKTTAEMQTPTTFTSAGWSTDIWNFVQGEYPKLWWQN